MSQDAAGKEEGFHRLTSEVHLQAKTVGVMDSMKASLTTTRENAAEGIQKKL